ncbi:pentatricopeptide repeat-containing protein At2g21090 isoform X1 [Solanum tuberosum]|uniref:pentatricopeptide repeat-containing protein At2g21090 isoform X1 n=1 Tax=Solanum tuberosum TaxID=4113 RepID=UPI0003D26291|nr:PREDICTED: pentatricopeptide repeat-containing protein At2g21090 isoform X1 [Solanum tuberosum]
MPTSSLPSKVLTLRTNKKLNNSCLVQKILNLSSQGYLKQAFNYLNILTRKGIRLNSKTLASIIQQCANSRSREEGKWIHLHLKTTGWKHPTTFLANHLINMYGRCGDHMEARKVFDKMTTRNLYSWNNMLSGYTKLGLIKAAKRLFDQMPEKDVVSWNTMVIGHAQVGYFNEALKLYREFRRLSIGFNEYSFAGVITACVKSKDFSLTGQVHCQVFIAGFLSNIILSSSIVDAYAKCGKMSDARRLFDAIRVRDVLAWTTLVSGYSKCGDMVSARELFEAMPEKNPVSWTALVAGYSHSGMSIQALELFAKMMKLQVQPDQFTFSSCLSACAGIASLKHGKQIHAFLVNAGFRPNTIVLSSLIDMYSKCGSLEVARRVFDTAHNKHDAVLWNTMLSALAQHGMGEEAIEMFFKMMKFGVKPNRITFVVLLNACSHSGLVQEGLSFFETMTSSYDVLPDQEHFACIIDLLGRAGHFSEVLAQIKKMPCEPDDHIWNALLGVCRIHGNVELGRMAAELLIELDPQSPAAYLLLSSIYGVLGMWENVEKVRQLMNERHVRKEQAVSWLEIEHKMLPYFGCNKLNTLERDGHTILQLLADQTNADDLVHDSKSSSLSNPVS